MDELTVNAAFAAAFEAREQKRLGMKEAALRLDDAADAASSSDSSSDDDDDDDGEEVTPAVDLAVLRTINAIRAKDPRIYDATTRFFPDAADEAKPSPHPKAATKPLTYTDVVLRDHQRTDDDDDDDEATSKDRRGLAYDDEQKRLRAEAIAATGAADDDDDGEAAFFVRTNPNPSLADVAPDDDDDEDLKAELATFEARSSDKQADAFLADFVQHRKWRPPEQQQQRRSPASRAEHDGDSASEASDDDDDNVEAMEAFEASYNFRFEQGAAKASTIATHARHVATSLRAADERRRAKRERKKEERRVEKQRTLDELRRVKKQRLAEVAASLEELRKEADAPALDVDLEADFDPAEHDEKMREVFDDAYYDTADAAAPAELLKQVELDHVVDAAEATMLRSSEGGGATKKEQPPTGGGVAFFRYRDVAPNDYGLSAAEILESSDADLTKLVSVKRMAPYREQEFTVSAKRRRKWRLEHRARGEASRLSSQEDADKGRAADGPPTASAVSEASPPSSQDEVASSAKKKKTRRKKAKEGPAEKPVPAKADKTRKRTKKQKKDRGGETGDKGAPPLSKARLQSYGL